MSICTVTTDLTEVEPWLSSLTAVVVRFSTLFFGFVSTRIRKLLVLADAPALISLTTAPPVSAATASLEMRSNSSAAYGAHTSPWIDSCLLLPDSVRMRRWSPRMVLGVAAAVSSACTAMFCPLRSRPEISTAPSPSTVSWRVAAEVDVAPEVSADRSSRRRGRDWWRTSRCSGCQDARDRSRQGTRRARRHS